MGIAVEFNPDLALRDIGEFEAGARKIQECIPRKLVEDKVYDFLKREQRLYWLKGEIPLIETKGNENLSRPKASIKILEATHFMNDGEIWTKGKYEVIKVLDGKEIYFEYLDPIKTRKF